MLGILVCMSSAAEEAGVPVAVASPERQPVFSLVDVTGTVTSPRVAQLSVAISGLILAVRAEEGDRVAAGQVLVELDPELAELESRSARAQVTQADTALIDSRRRLQEAKTLGSSGGIAQTLVLDLASEVEQDSAALQQARAQVALREALVTRHTLKAPFAGVISRRMGEAGEWVTPGQGVLELVATDDLRMDFAVAEDFFPALNIDTPVQFSFNALPGESFTGRVQTLVPVTDPGARTLLLRVVAHDKGQAQDPRIMPGMSARATLKIPQLDSGLVIPRDALLRYPDGRVVVWTVTPGDSGLEAREKAVRTGQSFAGVVEIVEGLEAGEQIVVRGNEALQNGQRVRIIDAGAR
jgi:RND family efflux transporter MFP subunit